MHHDGTRRAIYRRTAPLAPLALFALFAALVGASAWAVGAPASEPSGARAAQEPDYPLPLDRDGDGVPDSDDRCPSDAGDLRNGCPSELNAEVRGRWQVNRIYTKLVSLTVAAPYGSRIELTCSGRIKICGKKRHVIAKTTHRLTSLTRYFVKPRIYPSRLSILVKVTRPQQIGVYKRYATRKGRRLPATTERCLSTVGRVQACA
jgi:hypothetical protein